MNDRAKYAGSVFHVRRVACDHDARRIRVRLQMLQLVRAGLYSDRRDRAGFLRQLRCKLDEFTDNFLPHMKEEEEIFQPLLMKYFGYDELRELKQDVLQNHHLSEKADLPEKVPEPILEPVPVPKPLPAPVSVVEPEPVPVPVPVPRLPPEVLTLVFAHLRPADRAVCAAVCRQWRSACLAPRLWRHLSPAAPQGESLRHVCSPAPADHEDDLLSKFT